MAETIHERLEEEGNPKERRRSLGLILLLLLLPLVLCLAAQQAIHSTFRDTLDTDALSRIRADYQPWAEGTYFLPLDPAIFDDIERDILALGGNPARESGQQVAQSGNETPVETLSPSASPTTPVASPAATLTTITAIPLSITPITTTPVPSESPPALPDPPDPPPPPPGGTISGRVFHDANYGTTGGAGSGYDGGANDTVQAGLTVQLYNAGNLLVATTATDPGGQFSFAVASNGTYRVHVPLSDFAGAIPEQTYEHNGVSGNGVAGARGGDDVTVADDWNVSVSVASANVSGVEVGYSYDLIVNTASSGQGSLDQFIKNANSINGANTAQFAIPVSEISGSGFVIAPPAVGFNTLSDGTGATIIDGQTQESNIGDNIGGLPDIVVRNGAATLQGFSLFSPNNRISNLAIELFEQAGVEISGNGNVVSNCVLTDDVDTPSSAIGAVHVIGGADDVTISGNRVYSSGDDGIRVAVATSQNIQILNNTVDSSAAQGMTLYGTLLTVSGNTVTNTTTFAGIEMVGVTNSMFSGNILQFNPVGLYVYDGASNNQIGPSNQFIDNSAYGLWLEGNTTTLNTVSNNTIASNDDNGILIDGSPDNDIGPLNTITGNQDGIRIQGAASTLNEVTGNSISTNTDDGVEIASNATLNTFSGNTVSGNSDDGFDIDSAAASNVVQLNTINGNGDTGVEVSGGAVGNVISQNSIYNNGGPGIDLSGGGNNGLAEPVILTATVLAGDLTVTGTVGAGQLVEIYDVTGGGLDVPDGSGMGEGPVFLGAFTEGSGADGDGAAGSFSFTIVAAGVGSGDVVTATARDTGTGDTSEFATNGVIP